MPALSPAALGILLMLVSIFLFGIMDVLAKALVAHYPVVQVVWSRYAGQTAIVLLLLAPRLHRVLPTRRPGAHLARSLLQFGATASFFTALGYIALVEAVAIMEAAPVLITLGAALFLGERLGPRRLAAVIVALAGALIVLRPGMGVFSWAGLLPLCAAACYAGYALITRHIGATESVWTSIVYTAMAGTIIASVALPFVWVPVAAEHWLPFAAIGAVGALAQLCMIRAFMLAEASMLAPFAYLGLIFAVFWGIVLFDEWPDGVTILGALVIVGAGLYVWHRETRGNRGKG